MEIKKVEDIDLQSNDIKVLAELYRVYEYDCDLYFPEEHFPCGNIKNYVNTGIISQEEAEEIWNANENSRCLKN